MSFRNKFHSHYTCSSLNCFSITCMLNILPSRRELESLVSFRMAVEYPFTTIDRSLYFVTYLGGVHYFCYAKHCSESPCVYTLVHRFACFPKKTPRKRILQRLCSLQGLLLHLARLFLQCTCLWSLRSEKAVVFLIPMPILVIILLIFFPNQYLKNAFL